MTRGRIVLYRFGSLPSLSLTMIEHRTTKLRTFSVRYLSDGGDYIALVSGVEKRPKWVNELLNMKYGGIVTVEICEQTFDVVASEINEEYRDGLLGRLCENLPLGERYEIRSRRYAPLVRLKRIASY
ncbi:nitroreductase/quinone reductase family protein [Streptosporangium minutum]|nr:nitroreductase/quinone reductase family protein [Streptosporangium minutum]